MARLEFESIEKLKRHLQSSTDLRGAAFQNLDLSSVAAELKTAELQDNVLLGCVVPPEVLALFSEPLIFPKMPGLPFEPFRATLYSPEELLGAYEIGRHDSYAETVDGLSHAHYTKNNGADSMDVVVTLARRLHDHAITDALQEFVEGKKVVAIMGGHSMLRDNPKYLEVAQLSAELTRAGFLATSGGGPGAMEATHLGAWFAERSEAELKEAVAILAQAPLYTPTGPWLDTAFTVREKFPLTSIEGCTSLGVPTWLYGHEPPTCFATHIAKYFANSVREEGLLAMARHGVVFSPGSAGTIQEIFQDATQNHYASFEHPSPMVFFGEQYWQETKPVYPLVCQLAEGEPYRSLISITDDRREVVRQIQAFTPPVP